MKIALTTDSFIEGNGGISTAVAAQARNLRVRGHDVRVYTAADPAHEHSDLDIIGLRALRYERLPGGRAPLAPVALVHELAEFAPDMIHNHSMGTMGIQALVAARLLGIPILGTCHVFLAGFLRYAPINLDGVPLTKEAAWRYTVAFFNQFPQVTTPSKAMLRKLIRHGLQVPGTAVSNGVDTDLFLPAVRQREVSNALTLLHVGRLGYEKSVDQVLRAFAVLLPDFPLARLRIVGDGPERDSLQALSQDLGIDKQVTFMGRYPHENLPAIYQSADVFVTASTIETQGLVVLEALACGLPVVGVDALALPELIQDDVNGFLVPPNDIQRMTDDLALLLQSPELRLGMGRMGREFILAQHNLSSVAVEYENLYKLLRTTAPRSLLARLQKARTISVDEISKAFWEEVTTLTNSGAGRVVEIASALRTRGKNILEKMGNYWNGRM